MTAESLTDDAQLVRRIAKGDRQALSELYALYQRPLFTYLLQLTPDYGLAEELLQDTLVAVWKSARTFEGRSKVLTWLIGIARRQAYNTLRQHWLPLADLAELEGMPASGLEPAVRLSPGDGGSALLQWLPDSRVLRQLAARASNSHVSRDDLCLPETCLSTFHSHIYGW